MKIRDRLVILTMAAALFVGCGAGEPSGERAEAFFADGITVEEMQQRVAGFAPAVIDFDDSDLEPWETEVLSVLIEASDIMHDLFVDQVSPENVAWQKQLESAARGPDRDAALAYFDVMIGPWDRMAEDEPFLDVGAKPLGAGYYPSDLTRDEFEEWLRSHPEDRQAFTSYFTVIQRDRGNLIAVPYSVAYRERLEHAATLLREAAELSEDESLSTYLRLRADAFLSDDYLESDMAWMDLTSRIEPTIGPYEVYEDQLLGYKTAFESFVTVADAEASAELDELKDAMRELEAALPIEDRHKNVDRGFESPIRVVDVVYTAGDTRAGAQTLAFNLPNDDRVRDVKGSKKVMLRNVMHAKFDQILSPIAGEVLTPGLLEEAEFRPWFVKVLMHELAHGLGPGTITLEDGTETTASQALREHYSPIEEAKADIAGLHSLTVLSKMGFYDDDFVRDAFLSHLADLFRSVRFGAGGAHGLGALVQFNYLLEDGAVYYDEESGRFGTDPDELIRAVSELANVLLTVQAEGDYEGAGALLERYGTMAPEMRSAIDRLDGVPVDIRPEYTVLEKMEGWE